MAFAPDYARSGRFYLYYTDSARLPDDRPVPSGGAGPRLEADRDQRPAPALQPQGRADAVRPRRQALRGLRRRRRGRRPRPQRARTSARMLGKLIRIEPRAGRRLRGARRQPVRAAPAARCRRSTPTACATRTASRSTARSGALTIGDVGQDAVEEIDYVRRPRRRPAAAGRHELRLERLRGPQPLRRRPRARRTCAPVLTHSHDAGWCSIIGGYVIRDPTLGRRPARALRVRRLLPLRAAAGATRIAVGARSRALGLRVSSLVSFGEDGRGHVYAISSNGGIYRIAPR